MDSIECFYNILKSSLWGTVLTIPQDFDEWGRVFCLAKSHSVLGLVANAVLSNNEIAYRVHADEQKNLKVFLMSNIATHTMLNNTMLKVVGALRLNGVDPVLLKGQGIAKYYPIPELRQCGDIDIYVGQEAFEKSCSVIMAMSTPEDHQRDIPSLKHFHTRIGPAFIEIHRYTDVYWPKRYDRQYQKISDEGMSSKLVPLDFSGVHIMSPPIDFNVFYIFNHFWHHFIADGVGLRQICDWVMLLHASYGKIDLNNLSDMLVRIKLMKEWKVFGCIAVEALGLPADEMPFYDTRYRRKASKVLDLILLEGNFGRENLKGYKRPKGYFSGKFYSFIRRFRRNLRVLCLFPAESIRHILKIIVCGISVMFYDKLRI